MVVGSAPAAGFAAACGGGAGAGSSAAASGSGADSAAGAAAGAAPPLARAAAQGVEVFRPGQPDGQFPGHLLLGKHDPIDAEYSVAEVAMPESLAGRTLAEA
ncbi:MAG: hypothetical protein ACKOSQ_09365, partial [Planctomycetaceae bacterium]